MSSKSILITSSYTVSKFTHVFETQCGDWPVNAVSTIAAYNGEAVGLGVLLNNVTHLTVPNTRPYWHHPQTQAATVY